MPAMPAWSPFLVVVLVVFVMLAPRRVLGPVIRLVGRRVGAGVAAMVLLGCAIYLFSAPDAQPYRIEAFAVLAVGGVCATWWIYRRIVPAWRDPATAPSDIDDAA
jgi:hypothetical protein